MCNRQPPVAFLVLASLTALGSLAAVRPPSASDRPGSASLQGAWRTAEVKLLNLPGTTTGPQPGLTIFTAKHYSRVEVHDDHPRPALRDAKSATADELRAAWGPFFAEAGTYDVSKGNVLTLHPVVAKNPATMTPGFFRAQTIRLQGDTLWLTQLRDPHGRITSPVSVKLVRVE